MVNNCLLAFAQNTKWNCNSLLPALFLALLCCARFFDLWLKTQRFVLLACFATLTFAFILRGWCFVMSKRYLHSFGNDDRVQHFSRRNFPCCSHTKHSMNVSNNDNQLSTIKTLAKGQEETEENFPVLAGPVQRVCCGGCCFFATLRASRDENAASGAGFVPGRRGFEIFRI